MVLGEKKNHSLCRSISVTRLIASPTDYLQHAQQLFKSERLTWNEIYQAQSINMCSCTGTEDHQPQPPPFAVNEH